MTYPNIYVEGTKLEDVTEDVLHPCYWFSECGSAGIYGGHLGSDMERKIVACAYHASRLTAVK